MPRNMNARLKKLEHQAARRRTVSSASGDCDDEERLRRFEEVGRRGVFRQEPDFPVALEQYREAIARAKLTSNPPFDPPASFSPGLPEGRRRRDWVHWHHPNVEAAEWWLRAIGRRVAKGVPPVTEAEFWELANWFKENENRLHALSRPSYMLGLGDGRQVSVANLLHDLGQGPRGMHAGGAAEAIRRLRAKANHGPRPST